MSSALYKLSASTSSRRTRLGECRSLCERGSARASALGTRLARGSNGPRHRDSWPLRARRYPCGAATTVGSVAPFERVQEGQQTCPFSTVVVPPFDQGTLWSACQLSQSHSMPSQCV